MWYRLIFLVLFATANVGAKVSMRANIIFQIDMSRVINKEMMTRAEQFVTAFIKDVEVSPTQARFNIRGFTGRSGDAARFVIYPYGDAGQTEQNVLNTARRISGTSAVKESRPYGLWYALGQTSMYNMNLFMRRIENPLLATVFLYNGQVDESKMKNIQNEMAKVRDKKGIRIYVVVIGQNANIRALRKLVGDSLIDISNMNEQQITKAAVDLVNSLAAACAIGYKRDSKSNQCVDRCPDYQEKWNGAKCVVRCGRRQVYEGGKCVSKCRGKTPKYDTTTDTCVAKTCRCYASGDPHYHQFDGQKFDFMGTCKYAFTKKKDQLKGQKCYFNVEEKNLGFGNSRVSYARMVSVDLEDMTFSYSGPTRKVLINGIDFTNSKFPRTITTQKGTKVVVKFSNGRFVVKAKECGLRVVFKDYKVEAYVSSSVGSDLEGLCGTCNGDRYDDSIPKGKTTPSTDFQKFAASWSVPDDSGLEKWPSCQSPPFDGTCRGQWANRVQQYCGTIKDMNGPFKNCINSFALQVGDYYNDCKLDVCYYSKEKTAAQTVPTVACEDVAAFAYACADAGFGARNWRGNICPLQCGPNQYYSPKIYPSCQKTCDGEPANNCVDNSEPEDGCMCKAGYVRLGNDCVRPEKCGCDASDGQHVAIGQSVVIKGCAEKFKCVRNGQLQKVTGYSPCSNVASCTHAGGKYACVCNKGFTGDGHNCKAPPAKQTITKDLIITLDISTATGSDAFEKTRQYILTLLSSYTLGESALRIYVVFSRGSYVERYEFINEAEVEYYSTIIRQLTYTADVVQDIVKIALEFERIGEYLVLNGVKKSRSLILIGGFQIPDSIQSATTVQLYIMHLIYRVEFSVQYYAIGVTTTTTTWQKLVSSVTIKTTIDITSTGVSNSLKVTTVTTYKKTTNLQMVITLDGSTATGVLAYYETLRTILLLIENNNIGPNSLQLLIVFYNGIDVQVYQIKTISDVAVTFQAVAEVFVYYPAAKPNTEDILAYVLEVIAVYTSPDKPRTVTCMGGMAVSNQDAVRAIIQAIQVEFKMYFYYIAIGQTTGMDFWKTTLDVKYIITTTTTIDITYINTVITNIVTVVRGGGHITVKPVITSYTGKGQICKCQGKLMDLGGNVVWLPDNNPCCSKIRSGFCKDHEKLTKYIQRASSCPA